MEHGDERSSPGPVIQQSGVVAFRTTVQSIEFCLITGRRSGRWGFPKGRVGQCTSVEEAALCEAWHEAGLAGIIVGSALGHYAYRKKGRFHLVTFWLMHVSHYCQQWKESEERDRRWATLTQALQLVDRPRLSSFLTIATERIRRDDLSTRPLFPDLAIQPLSVDPNSQARS